MDVSDLLDRALSGGAYRNLQQAFDIELERSGLTRTQVGRLLDIQHRTLDNILSGEGKGHDVTQVLKLGAFCGLDVSQTLAMYLTVLPAQKVGEIQDAIELSRLNGLFNLKELKGLGLIPNDKNLRDIVARIKSFFGISTLAEYESLIHHTLFSKSKRQNKSDKMLDFWTTASIRLFEQISNPHPYDRAALTEIIPHIRAQSQDVKFGLLKVARALYAAGVTLAFQPKIPNTNIKGATLVVDESPCIVITDHGRSYPRLWFSLLHELHHVLYDLKSITNYRYHLSGESALQSLQEDAADQFARDMLCSYGKLDELGKLIHNPHVVKTKAMRWRVHPSIVYATFQYRMAEQEEDYWGAFRNQFPNFDEAVTQLNNSLWEQPSITTAGEQIRALLSTGNVHKSDRDAEAATTSSSLSAKPKKSSTTPKTK